MLESLRFVVVTATTLLFAVPAIFLALFDRGGPRSSKIVGVWASCILRLSGARVVVEGAEKLPAEAAVLFVPSHRSLLDVPALYAALPPTTRFLAKRELFRIPLFGQALGLLGFVPIDRGDRRRAKRALEEAAARVSRTRPLAVFPEGTRNAGAGLLPFKKGAFIMAIAHGLPIVPIACAGGDRLLPPGTTRIRPGSMCLRIGRTFSPGEASYQDRHRLARAVREEILALLDDEEPARCAAPAAASEAPAGRAGASE